MKPSFVRPFVAVLGAAALSATLFGCSPAMTPEQELASVSHTPGHAYSSEYKAIQLGQTQETDRYSITFESAGWTRLYLAANMSKSINFFVQGTFTNNGSESYRLGSSAEAEFEFDESNALYASISLLDGEVIPDDDYVYPGETVTFIMRAAVPFATSAKITSVVVPVTLHDAGFDNGIYATHSSSSIGSFIFSVQPKPATSSQR